ncbi:MAG: DUF4085 family protein [Pseudomonadota bacterium]
MKYFTVEWWQNECENSSPMFERYQTYFDSIAHKLPDSLVCLTEQHTLHDAKITRISCNFASKTAVIELQGWDKHLTYPVKYTLTFEGVSRLHQDVPKQEALGDLGYWECELVDDAIEVRMLFVSSSEFKIVFTGFSFEHVPIVANS